MQAADSPSWSSGVAAPSSGVQIQWEPEGGQGCPGSEYTDRQDHMSQQAAAQHEDESSLPGKDVPFTPCPTGNPESRHPDTGHLDSSWERGLVGRDGGASPDAQA